MNLSWNSIRISIAGARLSHLAQKDKIWDYGSMVEQVKMIFLQMEKAKKKGEVELLKKYLSEREFQLFQKSFFKRATTENFLQNVSILEVKVHDKNLPDRFCALVEGVKRNANESPWLGELGNERIRFWEKWLFIRRGDWWVLDKIKN